MKKLYVRAGVLAAVASASVPSFAATDLSGITGAFTSDTIVAGVLAVGATLALVYATIKGAKVALSMIRG